METTRLGRTGLRVSRTAFGALPIQRVDFETARQILRKAYDAGITFYDTARGYSDSEAKLAHALGDVRDQIYIATKASGARNRDDVLRRIETSLETLGTDHVDLLQLHNPRALPDPDDPDSLYRGLIEAREQGMTRYIGLSNHRRDLAERAVRSGLYDTLQFPLSAISSDEDLMLPALCAEHDVGLIAMKAMSGGLLSDSRVAFAALRRFPNVVPIWGIQRLSELDEFLALEADPPALDEALVAAIERDRAELAGDFCRGCGYCLPCSVEIPINTAARISFLMRRSPSARFLEPAFQEQMMRINDCIECGLCKERCPYELDVPALLKRQLAEYVELAGIQGM
jgi:aryl-alcohol dehydrogenase-like predicted oxidoreductase